MTFRRNTLAALLLCILSAGHAASAESVKLTILGVGDIYDFRTPDDRGGFARLNAVARAERAANPNTLYLFDGDMLSPSLLSGLDKGQNTITLTNLVPFDLAVPGNHEFDFGPENFAARLAGSAYPWAAVNITRPDGSVPAGLGGVTVKDIAGLTVALVPIALDATPVSSQPGELRFARSVDSGVAAARAARDGGADLVIAVTHTDVEQDRALIASRAFDVVISGHDHSFATSYDGFTAYVETSTEADYLAPLDLNVTVETKDGKRSVRWTPAFRFIDTAAVTPDPETQKVVDDLASKLDGELNVVIGTTAAALDSRRAAVRGGETAIGNLITDAMRAATGADIALTNGGGIRGDREYAAGTRLTRRDILTELPFGNLTVVTELPGAQILAALENGVSQAEKGAGRFPQVSGISFAFDPTAPAGSRVSDVKVGATPLEPDRAYSLATNDFLLRGGDGYAALGGGRVTVDDESGRLMATDVIDYITARGQVTAAVEGRIVRLGG